MAPLIPGLGATELIVILIIVFMNIGIPLLIVLVVLRATKSSSAPSGAPAGWYPDPSSRHELRYWTGLAWDSAVSDAGAMSRDALET